MNLWIRSQNKKCLIRASMFNLDNDETGIYCYSNEENFCLLGKYKSKERALKVLDEIQNILQPKMSVQPIIEEDWNPRYIHRHFVRNGTEVDVIELNTYVYEMPEE